MVKVFRLTQFCSFPNTIMWLGRLGSKVPNSVTLNSTLQTSDNNYWQIEWHWKHGLLAVDAIIYHHSSAACGILDCTEELFSFLRSINKTDYESTSINYYIDDYAMTEGLCLRSISAMSVHGICLSLNTWTDNITLLPQTGQRKKKISVLTFSCVTKYKIECTILRTIVIEIT